MFRIIKSNRVQGILSAALAAALLPALLTSGGAQDGPPLPAGKPAPAFKTKTLDGKPLVLKALRGKVVLLDVWATWCGPCRMATPMLQSLHQKFGNKGLKVIGLSVDAADTSDKVKPFQRENKLTYAMTVAPDVNPEIAHRYNADGIPSIYLIDQQGIVRWSQSGYEEGEEKELSTMISRLLTNSPKPQTRAKISKK